MILKFETERETHVAIHSKRFQKKVTNRFLLLTLLLWLLLSTLHPNDDERDVLPPQEDDPVDCLQLTTEQIRHGIYRLNCDSSSGSTGWTNALLRRLCDDRDSASLRIAETPHLPIHIALTAFFNKILRGEILGGGHDLLLPKGPQSFRPLRIECALMRLFSTAAL